MNSAPSEPVVETHVTSGYATLLCAPLECAFEGISLSVAEVQVAEQISYTQHSRRHLMLASLGWDAASHGNSLSVAPGGSDRSGTVRRARLRGAVIAIEPWLLDDACEQSLGHGWQSRVEVNDPKAAVLARFAAAAAARADALACETLLQAAARHLGRAYASASMRRDDGWLPPGALIRIID